MHTMKIRDPKPRWSSGAALLLALVVCLGPTPTRASTTEETRAKMSPIFEAMRPLLLRALDQTQFSDPSNRAEIGAALEMLEQSSAELARHGLTRGPGFEHLGALLASDAKEAHRRWRIEDAESARYLVLQLTETCVACHSRLSSERDSSLSRRFIDEETIQKLPVDQRALIQYATRQFAAALDSYEAILVDPSYTARDIDMMGHLDEYLEICVRVRNQPKRAIAALTRFADRPDIAPVLRTEVQRWIDALKAPLPEPQGTLEQAEQLAEGAKLPYPGRSDRDGLVEYLQAGAVIHQLLDAGIEDSDERARALYILGLIDTRIGRSFWLSQAETFLEAAIRTDPSTPTARRSYDLLEQFLVAGYTGSAGENVPRDVRLKLESLRALLPVPGSSDKP